MQPELHLGPITVQTFGLMVALGAIAGGTLVLRRFRELGLPEQWGNEGCFVAVLGGLAGARLNAIVVDYDAVKDDLLGNLLTGTALVWYGGLIGGAIAVLLWARWRGILNLTLLDIAAPALAIGQAIGRIGCQLSGDGDYGIPWDGPWAMAYPDGALPTNVPVHPTPIYETLALGLTAYVLWRLRAALRPGLLFALYLVLMGTERFLVEFVRRNDEVLAGLTQAQLFSLAAIALGGAWLGVQARRRGLRADAPSLRVSSSASPSP